MNLGLLVALGFATLLAVVTLGSDLLHTRSFRIRGLRRAAAPRPGHRLIGAGVCLVCGTIFLTELARYRHWPDQRYHAMASYLLPVMLAAVVMVIAGGVVQARIRRRGDS